MTEVTVQGVVRPDGSLDLPALPPLPTGPVEVKLRPLGSPTSRSESWWEYLQRTRKEFEKSGHQFRSDDEIGEYIRELRAGDDRIENLYRRMNQQQDGEQDEC